MFVTISFWALAYASALAFSGEEAEAGTELVAQSGAGFGLALILVPVVFAAAAFASLREDAPIMTLAGMAVALAVALPLLLFRNPVAALISGYAAGAVVSLSRPADQPLRSRWIAAGIVAVVVHVGMLTLPAPTAWIAPALPFTAMGIADVFTRPTRETQTDSTNEDAA